MCSIRLHMFINVQEETEEGAEQSTGPRNKRVAKIRRALFIAQPFSKSGLQGSNLEPGIQLVLVSN